jgi:hypothetical protein
MVSTTTDERAGDVTRRVLSPRQMLRTVTAPENRLFLCEGATLLVVVGISALYARPLLEEWGFISFFNAHGLGGYRDFVTASPLRPLLAVPDAIQWLLSGDRPAGNAVGFAVLLLAKYGAARWAVRRELPGPAAWVVAALATTLLPWPGEWHLRYSAAQLSAVFLFVALGAVFRSSPRLSVGWISLGGLSISLLLATYEALFVCGVLLPLLPFLVRQPGDSRVSSRRHLGRLVRSSTPVALGMALYGLYALIITHTVGNAGYEGVLAHSARYRIDTLSGLWGITSTLYSTTYLESPMSVIVMVALLGLLIVPGAIGARMSALPAKEYLAMGAAVLLLPFLALPYAVYTPFLHDPERVVFPVSVGFVLLCIAALGRVDVSQRSLSLSTSLLIVSGLLGTTAFAAAQAFRDYDLQRTVLVQTGALAAQRGATSVRLQDQTGVLGDVYTFLPPTLETALRARGQSVTAILCTPTGVDRYHPVARRLGIATTPRCDQVPATTGPVLVLDAQWGPTGMTVTPAAP